MSHPISAQNAFRSGQRVGWIDVRIDVRIDDIRIRPLGPGDRLAVRDLLEGLSPASRYLRFGTPLPTISEGLLDRLFGDGTSPPDQWAWGAFRRGRLIGEGRLARVPGVPDAAEFALTVADHAQGRGLGRLLLRCIAAAAPGLGIERLTYYVLGDNRRMLRLLTSLGASARIRDGAAEGSLSPATIGRATEAGQAA